jgi:cell division protein FtsW
VFRRVRDRTRAEPLPRPPMYVVLTATVLVLNIVGLVMILSASAVNALSAYGSSWYFFQRQLIWALVGGAAFLVTSRVDYRVWRRLAVPLLFVAGVTSFVVLLPGVGIQVDGARRWLGVGFLRFQPSEIAKLALLVYVADVMARRGEWAADRRRVLKPVLVVSGVIAVLVLAEPDLDSTIVLALIVMAGLIVGGVPGKDLATLSVAGIAAAAVASMAEPYRRARVLAFLHPSHDTSNTGYQIRQSLIALGSGGVDGVGLGNGRAKWMFLPNAHTDFIFAIIGEELGLVGCLLVLGLFVLFGLVGLRIARRAPDRFGMLLAAGVTAWVVGQAAINLGAVVAVIPVSGIPLPFLSAGGSALLFTMTGAGILANIARQCPPRHAPVDARGSQTRHRDEPSAPAGAGVGAARGS